jgi:AraC family transcriptional activator of pobA
MLTGAFEVEGTVLFFANPHVPYSWETISTSYVGYTCLFSEEFYGASERSESLQHSPLFRIGGTPILNIVPQQREFLNTIFENMIIEQKSTYAFKDDLIRNYINLIIHEAQKTTAVRKFRQAEKCLFPHCVNIPRAHGKTISN